MAWKCDNFPYKGTVFDSTASWAPNFSNWHLKLSQSIGAIFNLSWSLGAKPIIPFLNICKSQCDGDIWSRHIGLSWLLASAGGRKSILQSPASFYIALHLLWGTWSFSSRGSCYGLSFDAMAFTLDKSSCGVKSLDNKTRSIKWRGIKVPWLTSVKQNLGLVQLSFWKSYF